MIDGQRRLQGCTAVVTGASRGLGLGFVRVLAAAGAEVWAVAEQAEELERACATVAGPARVHAVVADLRRRSDILRIVAAVQQSRETLSILVNNAAVLPLTSLAETDDATWDATLAVNLTAPFVLTRLVLPLMHGVGGTVINVSSRAGIEGFACETAYCASKFGIEGFTKAAALELEPLGIAINTVTPGKRIKPTGLDQVTFDALPEEERRQYLDPMTFAPAIEALALIRGRPSGLRFNLARLATDVKRLGFDRAVAEIALLAESRVRDVVDQPHT